MAAARQYYSAVAATRVTTSSTTAQVAATLTFTPDASSTYYILAFALTDSSTVGGFYNIVELFDATAAVVKDNSYSNSWTTGDKESFTGLCSLTSSASPVSQTYQVRYRCSTTGMTAGISDVLIIAVKAAAGDAYGETRTTGSTTSATFTARATVSFTPATAGTYVIVGKSDLTNGGSNGIEARIFDGTTAYYSMTGGSDQSAPQPLSWAGVVGTGSLSGAQTWTLQTAGITNNGGGSWINSAILALRVDNFLAAFLGTRVSAASTTTSSTPADYASAAGTPAAVAHLVLGATLGGVSAGSTYRFAEDGTALVADIPRTHAGEVAKTRQHAWGVLRTPTAVSHTWSVQKASNTAVSTELDEGQVVALQLDAPAVVASRPPKPLLVPSPAAVFLAAYTGV